MSCLKKHPNHTLLSERNSHSLQANIAAPRRVDNTQGHSSSRSSPPRSLPGHGRDRSSSRRENAGGVTKKEIAAAEEAVRNLGFELWTRVRWLSTACAEEELRFLQSIQHYFRFRTAGLRAFFICVTHYAAVQEKNHNTVVWARLR